MLKVLRVSAIAIGGLLTALVVLVVILGWRSPRDQYFDVAVQPVPVPDDPGAVARGRYFAQGIAVCGVCHGENMAGQEMSDSPIWGYIFTPNLTPGAGGVGGEYEVKDWVRAIRHGVTQEGRGFAFMPVDHYYHITDDDLGDIIAYLRSLPPVDNGGARIDLNIIPRALINSGAMGDLVRPVLMDHNAERPEPPATRGAYLALVGGCDFCHGHDLRGGQGPEPGAPPGPDITGTGRIGNWSFGDFVGVMAAGRTPDGHQINPMYMPWQGYRNMSAEDLRALFDHLLGLRATAHKEA